MNFEETHDDDDDVCNDDEISVDDIYIDNIMYVKFESM